MIIKFFARKSGVNESRIFITVAITSDARWPMISLCPDLALLYNFCTHTLRFLCHSEMTLVVNGENQDWGVVSR